MENLPMCRICLVQNVRMYLMVHRSFRELYEKLTDIPFVTEDRRPILACFFCCTKLKQCCQLLRKCLKAEEKLAPMRNKVFEPNPLINQDHLEYFGGFIKSPIENMSIVDVVHSESVAIKEELTAVCEGLDGIIEPKEEHQSDGIGAEAVVATTSSPFNLGSSEIGIIDKNLMKMEKLPMCRICLVQNVRMYLVLNRNFHELYEKLTDIPFVTEDRRPILACFFCCAKLEKCCQLMKKCLESEEIFALMMNEDYEPNPLINQDHEYFGGFIKSPIENISIVDVVQTESIAIKEELPAVCEGLDDITEPKKEHQSNELELENLDNIYLNVADIPPRHSESDLEDDVPLIQFKTELEEEQEVSKKKRRARETKRATVAKKPKLDTRRTKLEDAIIAEQTKKEKSDLKVIPTSHPGEKLKCDVCQRSFGQKGHLTQHIRIHTGEKPYKCDVCQRSFSRKSHLTRHIRRHTGEKPYKCNVCQRSFNHQSGLTRHVLVHTGEKPYKCDVCQRSFSVKSNLTEHIRIHTGERPYKCDVCQRSFSRTNHLTRHIRIHSGEKPYKCDVCLRSFSQKNNLTQHNRMHSGETPYNCDVCQRSFSVKCNLTQHIRIHTGEKPYKCNVCQRSYSQKRKLTLHIRRHTVEKLYKCDVCLRAFSRKYHLSRHNRIHTGEKPYNCDVCQRNFCHKSNLTRHILKHTCENTLN